MSNKFMQIASLVLSFVVALGGAGGSIAVVSHYVTSLETEVAAVKGTVAVVAAKQDLAAQDLHEIKVTLDTIAPRTTPGAHPVGQVVQGNAKSAEPNDDTVTWPARYLADHCKHCPGCCVTGVTP